MMNKIWFALLLIALLYGFGRAVWQDPQELTNELAGKSEADATATQPVPEATRSIAMIEMGKSMTNRLIDDAQAAVKLCLTLIGIMAFWLGFMRIAQDAGMITMLSRALGPVLRFLFPEVPRDHPAGGAMVMNIAANVLGLGNAATPLGLKAMKELQTLNPDKETATNAMATFLAINTSGFQIIPFTIIAYRAANGSENPAAPAVAIILASACATIVAIAATRLLQRFYPTHAGGGGSGLRDKGLSENLETRPAGSRSHTGGEIAKPQAGQSEEEVH